MFTAAYVHGLCASIPQEVGLHTLRSTLDDRVSKKNDTEDLIKMAEFEEQLL